MNIYTPIDLLTDSIDYILGNGRKSILGYLFYIIAAIACTWILYNTWPLRKEVISINGINGNEVFEFTISKNDVPRSMTGLPRKSTVLSMGSFRPFDELTIRINGKSMHYKIPLWRSDNVISFDRFFNKCR